MEKTKIWFAAYNEKYNGAEPFFYSTNEIELAKALENNSNAIIEEMKVLWKEKDSSLMKVYGDDGLQFPPQTWSRMVLKVWGLENKNVSSKFPYTAALLNNYALVTSCFVSKTSAKSQIRPHSGETNATIRIHLGLHIPEADVTLCGMRVGSETKGWRQGKAMAFLDAHEHEVWNNTEEDRFVLIVDILRPQYLSAKNFVCTRIVVNQVFFTIAEKINPTILYHSPRWILDGLTYILVVPFMMAKAVNNKFGLFNI